MKRQVIRLISEEDVNKIKNETIKVLEDVGVMVSHDEAKSILADNGAKCDSKTDLVKIPTALTEKCIKEVPQKITLGGRESEKDLTLQPQNEKFLTRPASGAESYIDPRDGKHRKFLLPDLVEWTRLIDGLENIDIFAGGYYFDKKLNLKARDVRSLQVALENTTKHIFIQPYGKQNLEYMLELLTIERGGINESKIKPPRFSIVVSPVPPLQYHKNSIDIMILAGKNGIPVRNCTMPICGAAAPVTVAGGVMFTLAEHLAGVVIHQLANPGAPIIFGCTTTSLDMMTGMGLLNTIENALMTAIQSQVCIEGFGWPFDIIGPLLDSPLTDGQAFIEACFNTIIPAYAGGAILVGPGNLETANAIDPVLLTIENEIFGIMERAMKPIEVNNDTLGVDVIRRIGAGIGKSYLEDEHTMKYFKSEIYRPKLFINTPRKVLESKGKKDLYERARERTIEIIEKHEPEPLDEIIIKEMSAVSDKADAEIKIATTV